MHLISHISFIKSSHLLELKGHEQSPKVILLLTKLQIETDAFKEDVSVEIDHSKEKEEMFSTFETGNQTGFENFQSYKSDFFGGVYSNQ